MPRIEFEKYTLPNGIQVILHVDRKLPIVHVNQWYHVGSKNEKPGRTGFAHLFEHMMFQGSGNAKEDYFTYVETLGANLQEGGVNGTTNQDRTNYFATVPSSNLETLLWLESDRLATLTEAMTKEKLDVQRDVVKNERRQGLENTPYGRWFKLVLENMYPAGHPYSWPVIGSHEDLSAASLEDVTDFFKTYYTPNDLSLVIAGDFDPAEAKRLVEKYFGSIPAGPSLDRPTLWIPTLSGEKIIEATDRVPQDRVYMTWPTPPGFSPGDADLDLASLILADGLSSRLNKALVYDRPLCTAVQAFQASSEIASWFAVIATARPGVSLEEIEKVVSEEIARLAKAGPTPAELARAKTKQEFQFVTALEGIGGFGGKSDRLNQYNTYLGDPGKLEWDMARYKNATPEAVRQAVGKYLDTKNRLLVRFRVEKSGRATEVAVDRTKEPPTGVDRPFVAPTVQTAKLPNGMDLFVVQRAELPEGGRHVRHARGRRSGSCREGRPGPHDRHADRHGHGDAQGARDRRRPRRPRHRADRGGGPRERARVVRDPEAEHRSGDGDRLGHHPQRRLSGFGVRPREEAPPRHARAAGEERQRRRGARALHARIRAGPPLRPPGAGAALDGRGHHPRGTGGLPRAVLEAGLLGARRLGRRHARRGDRPRDEALRIVGRRNGSGGHDSAAVAGARRQTLRRGPPGRRPDLRDRVPAGAAAKGARLLHAHARRHGFRRRRVRDAVESQSPRGEGLLLRRVLGARPLRRRGCLVLGRRRADEQDQGVGGRVRQGAEGDDREAPLRDRVRGHEGAQDAGATPSSSRRWAGSTSRSRTSGRAGSR